MPEWWEQDEVVGDNWYEQDEVVSAPTAVLDPKEAGKRAGEAWDIGMELEIPTNEVKGSFDFLDENFAPPEDFTIPAEYIYGTPKARPTLPKRALKDVIAGLVSIPKAIEMRFAKTGAWLDMHEDNLRKQATQLDMPYEQYTELKPKQRRELLKEKGLFQGTEPSFSGLSAVAQEVKEKLEPYIERRQKAVAFKYEMYGLDPPPKAETISEYAVDVPIGIGIWVGKLLLFRKLVGSSGFETLGRETIAWELLHEAEGGTPGVGAVTALALGGVGKIPASTFVGKGIRLTGESGVLAGITAASGGSKEDIIIAAMIPIGLRAWSAAVKYSGVAKSKYALKQMRKSATKAGFDLSNVPDSSLKQVLEFGKQTKWWNTQYSKGKITQEVRDMRIAELKKNIRPIAEAIAREAVNPPPPKQPTESAQAAIKPAETKLQGKTPAPPTQIAPKADIARPAGEEIPLKLRTDAFNRIIDKIDNGIPIEELNIGAKQQNLSAEQQQFLKEYAQLTPAPEAKQAWEVHRENFEYIKGRQKFDKLIKREKTFITDALKQKGAILSLSQDDKIMFDKIESKMAGTDKPVKPFYEMTYSEFVAEMGGQGIHSDINLEETYRENIAYARKNNIPLSKEVLQQYKSSKWAKDALAKMEKPAEEPSVRKMTQSEYDRLIDKGYTIEEIESGSLDVSDVLPKQIEKANAYSAAEDEPIAQDVQREVEEIKKEVLARGGFVDLPSVEDFKAISQKLKDGVEKFNPPERDVVTSVFGAIEKWRAETNKAGLLADWGKKSLEELEVTKDQKKLVDDWLDNPDKYGEGYDILPENAKALGQALRNDYKEMKDLAVENEVFEHWVENYTPHLYSDSESRLKKAFYPVGGKLGKKFRFAKQRKFETKDAAREAGLHPIDDPIAKNAVYKYQLYKVLANKNLIKTLSMLKREDGMPVIMGRPKKPEKLKVWEEEYQWVNAYGLDKYMYVGEVGEKGMLIKLPAKADPDIAKALNDVFYPFTPRANWLKTYQWVRGRIKRVVMYNPLIHSWNIWSDTLDEVNFNPYSVYDVQRRGKKLYEQRDELVEYAVDSGLNLQSGYGLVADLRKAMGDAPSKYFEFLKPLGKLEKWSDEKLWQGVVRSNQLGYFETLTEYISRKHPDWSREKVGQTAAYYINTLYGTIPNTWFTKAGAQAGSAGLFARNWTVSNIDMVVKAATLGRKGMGQKALTPEQRSEIGKGFAKHIPKGIFGLVAVTNLLQLGFLAVTNALKKKGIIDGEEEDLHLTFQNENKRHWFDVDTGLDNKKGQRIYLVAPLFRYIRDYIGWASEPAKTAYNKLEPLLKQTIEQIANYSVWREKPIVEKGAPYWERLKLRAKYFTEGVTPIVQITGRKGTDRTLFEFLVPFTGTWIRRGAPGGKFSGMMFKFREQEGYKRDQIDLTIDEEMQAGEFGKAINIIAETGRYKTSDAIGLRILQTIAPLNYYWHTMSKDEKAKFIKYLEDKGYSAEQLTEALTAEAQEIIDRED